MNTTFYKSLVMGMTFGLLATSVAMADFRDYNSKAWNSGWKGSSRSASTWRSNGSTVARSEAAPAAVTSTPAKDRAFSYEPSKSTPEATNNCGAKATSAPAPKVADKAVGKVADKAAEKTVVKAADKATSTRSFSYEPEKASQPTTTRYAPAMRGNYNRSSGGNSYDKAMRSKGY